MNHYVKIKHPYRIGEELASIPTDKERTSERNRKEIEVRVITAKAQLDTLWITKEDLI